MPDFLVIANKPQVSRVGFMPPSSRRSNSTGMRVQLDRVVATLCAGRDLGNVMARLLIALGLIVLAWLTACILFLIEPAASAL